VTGTFFAQPSEKNPEVLMIKPFIAIASMIAGGATVAAVVHMQTNPMAFTSRSNEATPRARTEQPRRAVLRVDPTPPKVVQKDREAPASPVKPLATPKRLSKRVIAPVESDQALFLPCSDWSEIGVKAVQGPAGAEPRQVRLLCPMSSPQGPPNR
jgi:hypothetical protein